MMQLARKIPTLLFAKCWKDLSPVLPYICLCLAGLTTTWKTLVVYPYPLMLKKKPLLGSLLGRRRSGQARAHFVHIRTIAFHTYIRKLDVVAVVFPERKQQCFF